MPYISRFWLLCPLLGDNVHNARIRAKKQPLNAKSVLSLVIYGSDYAKSTITKNNCAKMPVISDYAKSAKQVFFA